MSFKVINTPGYKYIFNSVNGFFARWGETKEDDPLMSPLGPEIADIEISTICNRKCSFCYKSNTSTGENMSFETFKDLFHKLPKNLTQIAFGIGSIDGNPNLWKIMEYTRENKVIPNITVNGKDITDEQINKLASMCGAVAISNYNKNDCYGTVQRLAEAKRKEGATLQQVNIHQLLAVETYETCLNLLDNIKSDKRLEELNAVVFLLLKPKGNRNKFHSINDVEMFKKLYLAAQEKEIQIGFDSCSAPLALKTVSEVGQENVIPSIEPCESTLFSIYINTKAEVFPCSFTEGTKGWEKGIQMSEVNNFLTDVWFSDRIRQWRSSLLGSAKNCKGCSVQKYCRACPVFDVTPCLEKVP